jgi:hypothetical protein
MLTLSCIEVLLQVDHRDAVRADGRRRQVDHADAGLACAARIVLHMRAGAGGVEDEVDVAGTRPCGVRPSTPFVGGGDAHALRRDAARPSRGGSMPTMAL